MRNIDLRKTQKLHHSFRLLHIQILVAFLEVLVCFAFLDFSILE